MDLQHGHTYFISDDFFKKVNDPYLKINYEKTNRPHYFGIKDEKTSLYWLAPLSSKTDKFEKIINKQKQRNKPSHGIKIIKIRNQEVAVLFQDMFPVSAHYITNEYIKNGQPYFISNPKTVHELQHSAKVAKSLLQHGVKFTPTQADVKKIESIMLSELNQMQAINRNIPILSKKMSITEKIKIAKESSKCHHNKNTPTTEFHFKAKRER